jgi:hypothetical protein
VGPGPPYRARQGADRVRQGGDHSASAADVANHPARAARRQRRRRRPAHRGRILSLADDLFDSPANVIDRAEQLRRDEWRHPDDPAPERPVFDAGTPPDYADSTSTLVGFAVLQRDEEEVHPDTGYNMYLPILLNVLRHVHLETGLPSEASDDEVSDWYFSREHEVDSIRNAATKLLATKPVEGYRTTANDDPLQGVLFPAAVEMQNQLGELLAISQRVFPTMPSPTFAF